jgi:hypothetical protein
MPYASSWALLDVIRAMPSLQSQRFVITTQQNEGWNKSWAARPSLRSLANPEDLRLLLKVVEAAGMSESAK